MTNIPYFEIREATENDVTIIFNFIKELAIYEKLLDEVYATEEALKETLFGKKRYAEVLLGYYKDEPVCFALFFHNYSTFVGKPGLYLEDIFVKETMRGKGFGKAVFIKLAQIAVERNCGRMEWAVLTWNEPAINFYKSIGALTMDEWAVNRLTGQNLINLANNK